MTQSNHEKYIKQILVEGQSLKYLASIPLTYHGNQKQGKSEKLQPRGP